MSLTFGMPYFEEKMREAEATDEDRYLSVDDVMTLPMDVVHANLGRRQGVEAMTGKWIVFANCEAQ
ncbi:hypothetical protein [Paraburkholderia domus]|uniref:hypothetical protein n=1 Tax=Paraburkholderia domus TaxID=2793075 RepID=UPI001B01A1BD|nr:hypothetical protein [Paraburkholderia domus]CAE6851630.1 hypothetical protein R75483_07629 [Paraburkholderia domus]